ncbi:hypothetical protein BD780_003411 [Clostridium tetanomorphum]|uniref:PDZ domain-containing protein n=1 Tax=Clostridium tetanomorphum TaxID=1553 RepID=A0A923EAQ4_CLOTT|nr:PDZ domain-containing protein [Clostridium tetanomorphum]KAJ53208.1 hypothetical protein CTM_04055 [Clostridium tetanomorphum DSM 665]MBC2397514.1 PDZ domain-containing protein [Clostridium tetanomorphum]MBP1863610.1 hypothetical protein [Clostridium tetanomorphum]NRS86186.1 hypothetical protein [Clostridium tetanomorphum]NRZ95735.1 hypothetical protein [Clostridium tetanomorphum]
MDILIYTLKALSFALIDSYSALFLIVLSIVLYRQNKKTSSMQKMIIGEQINSPFELTISQIVIGIFGGILASILMSYLGVAFYQNSAIEILFLISIFLMIFNRRFICFSYSGAILGILSVLNTMIAASYGTKELEIFKFDIASLMTMIAILHFVEGLLIMVDGSRGSVPVFTKRQNSIIGGFVMKRQWILPVALFIILKDKSLVDITSTTPMPNWWPIINSTIPMEILKKSIFILLPFYGVLGYDSITFTKSKKDKALNSGFFVILYGLALFGLAQLAHINTTYKIIVIIFAPLAHEFMIYLQKYREAQGKPKYVSTDGIKVLYVAPNSPAASMNIKSGDSLIGINDKEIDTEEDIIDMITKTSGDIILKIKRANGIIKEVVYGGVHRKNRLGIVFVPKYIPKNKYIVKYTENTFSQVLDKIKNKNKDGED